MNAQSEQRLLESAIRRRAIEAVIWGMPAVNFGLMRQALIQAMKGADNQIVYYSRLPSWKNQTLTPNPDSIYLIPFYDTHDGPVVLEIPPAEGGTLVGSIDDTWQTALEDIGPAGFDQGKGGKYLLLPPGFSGTPPSGYLPFPSSTFRGFALLRSILKSTADRDVAEAVAYGKRIRLYPLSQAANPPQTKFLDAADVIFDSAIKYDVSFFETLAAVVQFEPWLERDKAMIDQLKTIGIEKGKAFNPDASARALLSDAAAEAHAWMDAYYGTLFEPPFYPDTRWALPAAPDLVKAFSDGFSNPDAYPVDARGVTYSMAFFSAKRLGAGQFYLMTIKDKTGQQFSGRNTYRLRVPPDAPVKQYWSATLYDRATHTLIRNQKWSSRSSQSAGLQKNPDGSVDLLFGPAAPAGKESNWVPTDPARDFEVLFRLYGPDKSFFEKKWALPDIELIGK
jgi:hypothetical protein